MGITTLSSREFNQDASGAKRAALAGPVFITDRGQPAHVLLTIDEYMRLIGQQGNIVELLAAQDAAEIEFEIPRMSSICALQACPDVRP